MPAAAARPDGVQSLDRALDLLERMSDAGGEVGLTELAEATGLPLPTIHRLLRTLVRRGYARQLPSRRYALGPQLVRLGEGASGAISAWARPALAQLADAVGETANLAVLDGDLVVYVAQAPSRHAMRMFTEVGRRVHPHCTGVGKALLARLPDDAVRALLARTGMPARTEATLADPEALLAELAATRERGWALDDGEQEVGVRCFAVALPDGAVPAAVSVSGPAARVTRESAERVVPLLRATAAALATRPDAPR
ncbi:IclR family transcriptional regulator [Quadrisphaera sp. DSM 44207]|uniref:IclR family transcriptional regulator n=1 Tax=Quadrisphaera sp. DSM 44207 TaxID=1881057 RepID=UPI00087F2810|nr:IclR family transcriptional regulator [Quadrisphaera sp. DSM 44207]SDQ42467.1 transcriptional regulator, IclR family [Quadrisphaera sp. DSM 44207]